MDKLELIHKLAKEMAFHEGKPVSLLTNEAIIAVDMFWPLVGAADEVATHVDPKTSRELDKLHRLCEVLSGLKDQK